MKFAEVHVGIHHGDLQRRYTINIENLTYDIKPVEHTHTHRNRERARERERETRERDKRENSERKKRGEWSGKKQNIKMGKQQLNRINAWSVLGVS